VTWPWLLTSILASAGWTGDGFTQVNKKQGKRSETLAWQKGRACDGLASLVEPQGWERGTEVIRDPAAPSLPL